MTDEVKLTNKQRVFIDEYVKCFNASEAARRAGYSEKTARQIGQENLSKPDIKTEIQERMKEIHMSADEALSLQADIARGDITKFFTPLGNLDFNKLMESGNGRLVKKIKQKTVTKIGKSETDEDVEILETELELYPADAAQERILKILGKMNDLGDKKNPLNLVVEIVKASEAKNNNQ